MKVVYITDLIYRGVFRTQLSIYDGAFCKNSHGFWPLTLFAKNSIVDVLLEPFNPSASITVIWHNVQKAGLFSRKGFSQFSQFLFEKLMHKKHFSSKAVALFRRKPTIILISRRGPIRCALYHAITGNGRKRRSSYRYHFFRPLQFLQLGSNCKSLKSL